MYTVSEVTKISGVTVKTLYHYQKIGLLVPAEIGENGYRYYSDDELNVLQEILIYRKMKFSLDEIKEMLESNSNKKRIDILEEQRMLIEIEKNELQSVIETITKTIKMEKGLIEMKQEDKFDGLGEDNIYRTMSNVTVIFMKPYAIFFLVIFVYMFMMSAGHHIENLQTGSFWGQDSDATSITLEIVMMACIIGGIAWSIKIIFFTKTKDVLKTINDPYLKKKKRDKDK